MPASKLMKWLPKCLRPAPRTPARAAPLGLQTLEAREVLALYTWVGPANGGLWSDTNNWSTPNALGFPNAFDNSVSVVFNDAVNSVQNVDLNLSVDRITFNGNAGSIQLTESLTLEGDVVGFQIDVNGVGAYSITGPLSGGNLVTAGAGTLELTGANNSPNTHGTTSVHDGVLLLNDFGSNEAIPGSLFIGDGSGGAGSAVVRLAQPTEIANTAGVAVVADGLLDLNNSNEIVGGLVLAGGEVRTENGQLTVNGNIVASASPVTSFINGRLGLGGAARTVDGPGTLWINAQVSNGGLVKTGTGTLRLFGDNTYGGDTVLNAGTLSAHGSQPTSNVVVAGGVLSLTGSVGTVTTTGGVVTVPTDPADGATKNLTLAGATYRVDLYGPAAADRLDVTGAVNLTGAALDATRFVGGTAAAPAAGQAFTIIANDGADAVVGTFAGPAEGATFVSNGRTLQIRYAGGDGNDVVLAGVTPTPQPAAEPYAVGAGPVGGNTVRVYNPDGTLKVDVPAFEDDFSGGVRTATGDGVADLVVGHRPGPRSCVQPSGGPVAGRCDSAGR